MNRQDVLLKEYEVCQQDINHNASQYWVVVGIFMGINTVLLGWVVYSIIQKSEPPSENAKWLVVVLGLAVIAIVAVLWFWMNRVNFLIRISHHRMQEIETELGMRKNLIINLLDDGKKRGVKKEDIPTDLSKYYPPPRSGATIVPWMFGIVIFLWVFFIVVAWFPCIRIFIFCNG